MKRFKKLESVVEAVLSSTQKAREDDFILYLKVVQKINPDVIGYPFATVLLEHATLSLPSFESVSRCRRKLQEKYDYLRGSDAVEELRFNEELKYTDYSRED